MASAQKNESLDGLYLAVGRAMSNWAAVENQLYQIFSVSTSLIVMQPGGGWSADLTIPSAVLVAIDGFQGKVQMIRAALSSALRDLDSDAVELMTDGLAEIESVRTLHRKRNKLAHWTAEVQTNPQTQKPRFALAPPRYSSKVHKGVIETDIIQWSDKFIEANQRLSKYVERLASHQGLQFRHLELATSQVRCTLPADQTLLEHLKQQLSDYL